MNSLLTIAFTQLGQQEISGAEDNPQIVKYAKETGIAGIDNDEIPWCSTFINWCAMQAKLPFSGKANARSWTRMGEQTTDPKPGDLVVFWRESIHSWKGHVGIFLGFTQDGRQVHCLGGNQSNAVSIARYDAHKVLSFRRLEKEENHLHIPDPVLEKGDRGERVLQLQTILNFLGYNCGDADGAFGGKTDSALKILQADLQLKVDGVYGNITKNGVESLLQT